MTRSTWMPRAVPAVLAAAALAAGGVVVPLAAQDVDAGPGTPVSGTVYDSIHGRPLDRATVEALGTGVRTLTDARGHFTFALPPGHHVLGFSHAQVAAWPALVHERTVDVGSAPVVANVATASEATVVARTCGGGGAVVGGVVRDMLTRVPVARAVVEISGAVGGSREELGRIPTALDGSFHLCVGALPPGGVELEARIGSVRSRTVSVETGAARVVATDLNVLVSEPARISGVLLDGEDARPVADAMVRVDGTRLGARSGDDGTFLLRGVPPGAVTLAVEHVRYGRRTTEILAESGDSVHVEFELRSEAIPLEELVVRVTRASTAARDRTGTRFDALDRDDIDRLLERSQGFSGLLRNANIPGMTVTDDGRTVCVELSRKTGAFASGCQMADVYLNDVKVGSAALFLSSLQPEVIERIRVVSPLEAVGRYGGNAVKFGVLLIYTRGN